MGELGLFGIAIPKEYGGQGLDYMSFIVAIEELARVDSSQAAILASHNSLGIGPLYRYVYRESSAGDLYLNYVQVKRYGHLALPKRMQAPIREALNQGSYSKVTSGLSMVRNCFISNASTPISAGVTIQVITGGAGWKEGTFYHPCRNGNIGLPCRENTRQNDVAGDRYSAPFILIMCVFLSLIY